MRFSPIKIIIFNVFYVSYDNKLENKVCRCCQQILYLTRRSSVRMFVTNYYTRVKCDFFINIILPYLMITMLDFDTFILKID